MSAKGKRTSRPVTFTAKDQALLTTVDRLLAEQQYESFSELCKQALRRFLLESADTSPAFDLFVQLQKQVLQLELKLEALETQRLLQIDQQLTAVGSQVEGVQTELADLKLQGFQPEPGPEPAAAPPEDPLLNRLSVLLEDF